MKLRPFLLALAVLATVPQLACAQGGVLLQKPVIAGRCAAFVSPNLIKDSGISCANNAVTISDGTHGTLLLMPSVGLLPSEAGIINMTPGQPLFMGRGVAATATDAVDLDIRRTASYTTGGTSGFVNTAIRVYDLVTADRPSYEWGFLSVLDNNQAGTQGSENVAGYFQSHKRFAGAGTWALTAEMLDHVANPTSPSVTFEYDMQSKGTDTNKSRVIQDLWAKSDDGAATVVSYGQRFNTDANSTIATGIQMNGAYTNGINLSPGSYAIAPLIVGDGQKICTTGLCVNYILHSAGVTYIGSAGGNLVSFSDAGQIAAAGNLVSTAGDVRVATGHFLCLDGATCSVALGNSAGVISSFSSITTPGTITGGGLASTGAISASGAITGSTITGSSTVQGSTLALSGSDNLTMSGSTMVLNVGGSTRLSLGNTGVVGAQTGGAFAVGFTTGVSCSGAPTAAFASVGGIVTHC